MQNDNLEKQFEKWQLQLRKGVLIYMVLVVLDQGEMYGYALISSLAKKLETDMAEGTIGRHAIVKPDDGAGISAINGDQHGVFSGEAWK